MDELEQYRQRLRIILEAEKICVFELDGVVCSCSAGAAFYPRTRPILTRCSKRRIWRSTRRKPQGKGSSFTTGDPGTAPPDTQIKWPTRAGAAALEIGR